MQVVLLVLGALLKGLLGGTVVFLCLGVVVWYFERRGWWLPVRLYNRQELKTMFRPVKSDVKKIPIVDYKAFD